MCIAKLSGAYCELYLTSFFDIKCVRHFRINVFIFTVVSQKENSMAQKIIARNSILVRNIFAPCLLLATFTIPSFAATEFYVAQDAKTHACLVSDKKPDGKMMMDAGTKAYASKSNAEQAMANLKVCAAAATQAPAAKAAAPAAAVAPKAAATAPATTGFYVEQDAKSHKCMVDSAKPDGKIMIDVGTKVYETKGRADQAMSMLKVCKSN